MTKINGHPNRRAGHRQADKLLRAAWQAKAGAGRQAGRLKQGQHPPVQSSHITIAKENTSTFSVTAAGLRMISGAVQGSVPRCVRAGEGKAGTGPGPGPGPEHGRAGGRTDGRAEGGHSGRPAALTAAPWASST